MAIKNKHLVAIPAADVNNDDPATPAGVVIGHDGDNVYVCTDGQCRMTAKHLLDFLSDAYGEAAPVGSRISRGGSVIPNDYEITNYSEYYALGTLLSPYMWDETCMAKDQQIDTVLIDVNCGPISLAKLANFDPVQPESNF